MEVVLLDHLVLQDEPEVVVLLDQVGWTPRSSCQVPHVIHHRPRKRCLLRRLGAGRVDLYHDLVRVALKPYGSSCLSG